MIDLANEALRYELYNFLCGEIEYDLVYGEGVDLSILRMDRENQILTLQPSISSIPGFYDQIWIRFYYSDYPEIFMDV